MTPVRNFCHYSHFSSKLFNETSECGAVLLYASAGGVRLTRGFEALSRRTECAQEKRIVASRRVATRRCGIAMSAMRMTVAVSAACALSLNQPFPLLLPSFTSLRDLYVALFRSFFSSS